MSNLLKFVDSFKETIERTYNVEGLSDRDLHTVLGPLAQHYVEAKKLVDNEDIHALFISVTDGGVYDVATDDVGLIGLKVVVIDETVADTQGNEIDIEAQDGTFYKASIKNLEITSPHFDAATVFDAASENTWANSVKL